MRFSVGEAGIRPPWDTFTNVDAEFDKVGDEFTVSAAGADLWQAANEFGAVYLPGGVGENFVATVKVAAFDATHANAKAGIMVRNQIPQGGGNDNPATSCSARRATARPSTCTTPAATARSTTPASRWPPVAARAARPRG